MSTMTFIKELLVSWCFREQKILIHTVENIPKCSNWLNRPHLITLFSGVEPCWAFDMEESHIANPCCLSLLIADSECVISRRPHNHMTTGTGNPAKWRFLAVWDHLSNSEVTGVQSCAEGCGSCKLLTSHLPEQVLDPALTRPGRLSRRVVVPLPDERGRADILAVHLRSIPMVRRQR